MAHSCLLAQGSLGLVHKARRTKILEVISVDTKLANQDVPKYTNCKTPPFLRFWHKGNHSKTELNLYSEFVVYVMNRACLSCFVF